MVYLFAVILSDLMYLFRQLGSPYEVYCRSSVESLVEMYTESITAHLTLVSKFALQMDSEMHFGMSVVTLDLLMALGYLVESMRQRR